MKQKILTTVAITLFLTALVLTLYPLTRNYVNQKYAFEIQTTYQEIVAQTDDSALEEAMVQATAIDIVEPHDTSLLGIAPGEYLCTLVTCHPYASGRRQLYLVFCERI